MNDVTQGTREVVQRRSDEPGAPHPGWVRPVGRETAAAMHARVYSSAMRSDTGCNESNAQLEPPDSMSRRATTVSLTFGTSPLLTATYGLGMVLSRFSPVCLRLRKIMADMMP